MIQVGKFYDLEIANRETFGVYLDGKTGDRDDNILLPNNQVTEDMEVGDKVSVFVYRDSEDRLIATRKTPLAQVGDLAYLKVVQTTGIGAFLDFGLEKDVLLPFAEQKYKIQEGRSYLVYIYVDKSGRLSATTDVEKHLKIHSPYKKGDRVKGTVYMVKSDLGAFVAVDNEYRGLIQKNEYFNDIRNGDIIDARIINIKDDGKLDLSPRKISYKQMGTDADQILKLMKESDGFISLNDKSNPAEIKYRLKMSKSAFKRAVGRLLKEDKIEQTEEGIRLK